MDNLHQAYKRETGKDVRISEIGVVRWRGVYRLDPQKVSDDYVFDVFGKGFNLVLPDPDFIEWMKTKLNELI